MHPRAQELVTRLGLAPHPEGGHFLEIHRSKGRVRPLDGRPERAALTLIHFLLEHGPGSRLHRVASDEVWHWVEGGTVDLVVVDPGARAPRTLLLGPLAAPGAQPVHVVPAGAWQAAKSRGPYALVACAVGPGFEFDDFQMLRDLDAERAELLRAHPSLAEHV